MVFGYVWCAFGGVFLKVLTFMILLRDYISVDFVGGRFEFFCFAGCRLAFGLLLLSYYLLLLIALIHGFHV